VLGGLWPLAGGRILKPGGRGSDGLSHDIFYVPQRPYVNTGTLQVRMKAGKKRMLCILTCVYTAWLIYRRIRCLACVAAAQTLPLASEAIVMSPANYHPPCNL